MRTFLINWQRLILLLLPTALRKPLLFSILRAATTSLDYIQQNFTTSSNTNRADLQTTSQVRLLKYRLNKDFGIAEGEIGVEITDSIVQGEWLMAYDEAGEYNSLIESVGDSEHITVWDSAIIRNVMDGFVVTCPPSFSTEDKKRVLAIVNKYRLASRRATVF